MEDNKEQDFRLDQYYEDRNDTDLASLDAQLAEYDPDNEFAEGGEMSQAAQFQATNKKPDPAMMALQGAASGAAAGAAFGPWGAAIGGVVGGAAGFIKGKAGQKKFEMMLDTAETGDNNAANMANGPEDGASSVIGGSQVGIMNQYGDGGKITPGVTDADRKAARVALFNEHGTDPTAYEDGVEGNEYDQIALLDAMNRPRQGATGDKFGLINDATKVGQYMPGMLPVSGASYAFQSGSVAKPLQAYLDGSDTAQEDVYLDSPEVQEAFYNKHGYSKAKVGELRSQGYYGAGKGFEGNPATQGMTVLADRLGVDSAEVGTFSGKHDVMKFQDGDNEYDLVVDKYDFPDDNQYARQDNLLPFSKNGKPMSKAEVKKLMADKELMKRFKNEYHQAEDERRWIEAATARDNPKAPYSLPAQSNSYDVTRFDNGGEIGMPNSLVDGAPNVFNTGGTHEESPLGGIPQGVGANGKPNLVEEGEVSAVLGKKKLIFSNRINI